MKFYIPLFKFTGHAVRRGKFKNRWHKQEKGASMCVGKEQQGLEQFLLELGEGNLGEDLSSDSVKLLICCFACLTISPSIFQLLIQTQIYISIKF